VLFGRAYNQISWQDLPLVSSHLEPELLSPRKFQPRPTVALFPFVLAVTDPLPFPYVIPR